MQAREYGLDHRASDDGVMDQVGMLKLKRELERDLSDCRANTVSEGQERLMAGD